LVQKSLRLGTAFDGAWFHSAGPIPDDVIRQVTQVRLDQPVCHRCVAQLSFQPVAVGATMEVTKSSKALMERVGQGGGVITCRERMGGLLKYYHREAA
jgi:hypothetical protein